MKISEFFIRKFSFFGVKILSIFEQACFRKMGISYNFWIDNSVKIGFTPSEKETTFEEESFLQFGSKITCHFLQRRSSVSQMGIWDT